jgi:hypothetical protein
MPLIGPAIGLMPGAPVPHRPALILAIVGRQIERERCGGPTVMCNE